MDPTAVILLLSAIITECLGYDFCDGYSYCEDGYYCCDDNTRCCTSIILSIGAIVGIAIGCLGFIAFAIFVICCCIVKSRGRAGQVIPPQQPGGNVTIITAGQCLPQYGQQSFGQPSYGHQPFGLQPYGQESYGQQPNNPPSYGQPEPFGAQVYGTLSTDPAFNQTGKNMTYQPAPLVH